MKREVGSKTPVVFSIMILAIIIVSGAYNDIASSMKMNIRIFNNTELLTDSGYHLEDMDRITYLSDVEPVEYTTSYYRDLDSDGNKLTLLNNDEEIVYDKGIMINGSNSITYNIKDSGYLYFASDIGINKDSVNANSQLEIYLDDNLYTCITITGDNNFQHIEIPLDNVNTFRIEVNPSDITKAEGIVLGDVAFYNKMEPAIPEKPEIEYIDKIVLIQNKVYNLYSYIDGTNLDNISIMVDKLDSDGNVIDSNISFNAIGDSLSLQRGYYLVHYLVTEDTIKREIQAKLHVVSGPEMPLMLNDALYTDEKASEVDRTISMDTGSSVTFAMTNSHTSYLAFDNTLKGQIQVSADDTSIYSGEQKLGNSRDVIIEIPTDIKKITINAIDSVSITNLRYIIDEDEQLVPSTEDDISNNDENIIDNPIKTDEVITYGYKNTDVSFHTVTATIAPVTRFKSEAVITNLKEPTNTTDNRESIDDAMVDAVKRKDISVKTSEEKASSSWLDIVLFGIAVIIIVIISRYYNIYKKAPKITL